MNVFGGKLESACQTIHVQNAILCLSAGGGIDPLPDNKSLDRSKLKEFADDNFEFDENGRKLS